MSRRLVGPDGKVLEALQELTRLAVQARTGERSRLMLDVAGHRAERRSALVELARTVIAQVRTTGEQQAIEPDDRLRAQGRARRGRCGRPRLGFRGRRAAPPRRRPAWMTPSFHVELTPRRAPPTMDAAVSAESPAPEPTDWRCPAPLTARAGEGPAHLRRRRLWPPRSSGTGGARRTVRLHPRGQRGLPRAGGAAGAAPALGAARAQLRGGPPGPALGADVIDVGSGAGLPGLALAIARPDVRMHLVEPMLRRTNWLWEPSRTLGLDERRGGPRPGRAVPGQLSAPVVTARAVARLGELARWSLPLLQPEARCWR